MDDSTLRLAAFMQYWEDMILSALRVPREYLFHHRATAAAAAEGERVTAMGEETKKALLADLDRGAVPAYKEAEIHKRLTAPFGELGIFATEEDRERLRRLTAQIIHGEEKSVLEPEVGGGLSDVLPETMGRADAIEKELKRVIDYKTVTGRLSSSAPNFQEIPWAFTALDKRVKNQIAFYNEVLGQYYPSGRDIHQSAHPNSFFVREDSCVLAPESKFEWRADNFDCQHCGFAKQCKEGMLAVQTLTELKDICGEDDDGNLCYGPGNEVCVKCALRRQCEHLHYARQPHLRPPDPVQARREQAKLVGFLSNYSEAPRTMAGRAEQELVARMARDIQKAEDARFSAELDRIAAEYEANVEEKKRRDLQRVHAQLKERGFPTAPITVAKHAGRPKPSSPKEPSPPSHDVRLEMDRVERDRRERCRLEARLERTERRLAQLDGAYVEPQPDRSGEAMIRAFRDFVVEPLITKRRG